MRIHSSLLTLLLLPCGTACLGITDDFNPGSGGQAGVAGIGGGAGDSGSGGTAGAAGGSAGTNALCSDYSDRQSTSTVTITYWNDGNIPLYLGSGSSSCSGIGTLYSVTDPIGNTVTTGPAYCTGSCDSQMMGGSLTICPGLCTPPSVILLPPGASYSQEWDGRVQVPRQMPYYCAGSGGTVMPPVAGNPAGDAAGAPLPPPASCSQWVPLQDAGYGLSVTAVDGVFCTSSTCDCVPDATGSCLVFGGTGIGNSYSAMTTYVPGTNQVDLHLGVMIMPIP